MQLKVTGVPWFPCPLVRLLGNQFEHSKASWVGGLDNIHLPTVLCAKIHSERDALVQRKSGRILISLPGSSPRFISPVDIDTNKVLLTQQHISVGA